MYFFCICNVTLKSKRRVLSGEEGGQKTKSMLEAMNIQMF